VVPPDAVVVEMPCDAPAAGAALSGVSDVVRSNAAIVVNATIRLLEAINPLRIDISTSSICPRASFIIGRAPFRLIDIKCCAQ
jgi:hypothetical protein